MHLLVLANNWNIHHNSTKISQSRLLQESSGVFLVRFSKHSGDNVLTLLYNKSPKHFIIQKFVSHWIQSLSPNLQKKLSIEQFSILFSFRL